MADVPEDEAEPSGSVTSWHYVGEADEPAFTAPFENAGTMSAMAFRFDGAGEVRLYGAVLCNGAPVDGEVFVLPDGYRPSSGRYGFIDVTVITSMGAASSGFLVIDDTGSVVINVDTGDTVFVNGSFPVQPPAVTP